MYNREIYIYIKITHVVPYKAMHICMDIFIDFNLFPAADRASCGEVTALLASKTKGEMKVLDLLAVAAKLLNKPLYKVMM